MFKQTIFLSLILFALSITYPLFKQCDPKWSTERLGTSSNTICSAGCLMSSAAMALNAVGNSQMNPSVLNKWLTSNGGYVKDDLFVWASINPWGVSFKGFITNDKIGQYISNGYIVILNVHNGGHWVLATSYQGDTIYVNDPGYSTTYYTLAQIVNGNTGVYTLNRMPKFLTSWLLSIEEFVYSIMGKQKEHQYPPVATFHELNNIRQE